MMLGIGRFYFVVMDSGFKKLKLYLLNLSSDFWFQKHDKLMKIS